MNTPYAKSIEDVLNELHASPEGLSSNEASDRQRQYGANELEESISRPAWKMLLAQFIEPMILILVAAAGLSFVLGNITEGGAILAIVVMFGLLGFLQEYRAEKAMAALRRMASPMVRVHRNGDWQEIPAKDLVPGDIVHLEAGNVVPADLRLMECINLGIMEAALTGESESVQKQTAPLAIPNPGIGDRTNMAFMGTVVAAGRGSGVVVQTGMSTELGKIAGVIQNIQETRTPLQKKLARTGRDLSLAGLGAAVLIFIIGILNPATSIGDALLTAASLLVAVVPEGLPAVITATLALGGRRMLKRHALIRKLPAVETLGSVTVICSDKTGTLTENKMTVTRLYSLHHTLNLADIKAPHIPLVDSGEREIKPILLTGVLCNDGHLAADTADTSAAIGDPTETAMLFAAERFGIPTADVARDVPRIAEFAFDSDRKRMATLHGGSNTAYPLPPAMAAPVLVAVKGSADSLLPRSTHILDDGKISPITDEAKQHFQSFADQQSMEGIRVLGFAFRVMDAAPADSAGADDVENQLVFCGLMGLMDPPREAVRAAIASSHDAGIRTVMITGDHPLTAMAIARNLGLVAEGDNAEALTGADLTAMTDKDLEAVCGKVAVYARVSPEDKLRIVRALQSQGQIVAMTGDGVNDSPALKQADIGVAMGITGTDVAKESSKMILLDDNYATIVAAVEEGRTIYDNLVRFIKYSFGGNLGKVLVMLLAPIPAFGFGAIALRPLHLLWLNLLTDGLMGMGLGVEASEPDVMKRPPRPPQAPILDRSAILHVSWMGVFICAASLLLAWISLKSGGPWQTVLFAAIGFAQIGQAWGLRSLTPKAFHFKRNALLFVLTLITLVFQLGVIYIPLLARTFKLEALPAGQLAATILLGVVTFIVVHLERRRHCRF